MQTVAGDFETIEVRMRQTNHRAANASVFDQQIGTATKNHEWNCVLRTELQHHGQFLFGRRFHINISRTADAQRGAPGQQLILP